MKIEKQPAIVDNNFSNAFHWVISSSINLLFLKSLCILPIPCAWILVSIFFFTSYQKTDTFYGIYKNVFEMWVE